MTVEAAAASRLRFPQLVDEYLRVLANERGSFRAHAARLSSAN